MTDAPERIWATGDEHDSRGDRFHTNYEFRGGIAYVRADLFDVLTAERDAALALVAAAYEAAARLFDEAEGEDIRALTPADALAAQAARDERMRAEGAKTAEARNARLVEALEPFAAVTPLEYWPDDDNYGFVLAGDFRRARAALQENGDE